MDHDRPLAQGSPGAKLAGMTVAFEHLSAQPGKVLLVPVAAGVAAGAESGDPLPFVSSRFGHRR